MTRLSDLPADVRAAVLAGKVRVAGGAGLVTTKPPVTRRTIQWRCFACREEFDAWAAAERHARATAGHRRIECLFTQITQTQTPRSNR